MEAQADLKIAQYDRLLAAWAYAETDAANKLAGKAVSFFLPFPPRDSNDQALLRELKRFILDENLISYMAEGVTGVPERWDRFFEQQIAFR